MRHGKRRVGRIEDIMAYEDYRSRAYYRPYYRPTWLDRVYRGLRRVGKAGLAGIRAALKEFEDGSKRRG